MSHQEQLQVSTRQSAGKGASRKLRQKDIVPGVYYDAKGENILLQIPRNLLTRTYEKARTNVVVNLEITGEQGSTTKPSLIRDIMFHPVKGTIIHVDFYGLDLTHEIKVQVPVEATGSAPGVKEGGLLNVYRDYIEVSCLPTAIPESIKIDVSGLKINMAVHIEDLLLPDGVTSTHDDNFAILGVTVPTEKAGGAGEGQGAGEEA